MATATFAPTVTCPLTARWGVDAYRLRRQLGYELGRDALREWLRRGGQPSSLVAVATRLPRAMEPLLHALRALS